MRGQVNGFERLVTRKKPRRSKTATFAPPVEAAIRQSTLEEEKHSDVMLESKAEAKAKAKAMAKEERRAAKARVGKQPLQAKQQSAALFQLQNQWQPTAPVGSLLLQQWQLGSVCTLDRPPASHCV